MIPVRYSTLVYHGAPNQDKSTDPPVDGSGSQVRICFLCRHQVSQVEIVNLPAIPFGKAAHFRCAERWLAFYHATAERPLEGLDCFEKRWRGNLAAEFDRFLTGRAAVGKGQDKEQEA